MKALAYEKVFWGIYVDDPPGVLNGQWRLLKTLTPIYLSLLNLESIGATITFPFFFSVVLLSLLTMPLELTSHEVPSNLNLDASSSHIN